MAKNIVSNFSESKAFRSMFWVLIVRKYSKLPKFIQKLDLNARMLRIFSDLRDKSALYIYIYVISRNKLTGLDKGYSN